MVLKFERFFSPAGQNRGIHLYLPDDYYESQKRCPLLYGNTAQFGKNRRRGIFPQPKVLKTGEYLVYFLFSKLRGWGKRPAIRPQTQLCGVALSFVGGQYLCFPL